MASTPTENLTVLQLHARGPALPPKADINQSEWNVRFRPKADISRSLDELVGARPSNEGVRSSNSRTPKEQEHCGALTHCPTEGVSSSPDWTPEQSQRRLQNGLALSKRLYALRALSINSGIRACWAPMIKPAANAR